MSESQSNSTEPSAGRRFRWGFGIWLLAVVLCAIGYNFSGRDAQALFGFLGIGLLFVAAFVVFGFLISLFDLM